MGKITLCLPRMQLSCNGVTSVCVCVCLFFRAHDSNLVVRRGKPEEVVADLIKQLGSVSTVAFQEEVALKTTFLR